jgi:DNA invertase Pin-like site-specific DNA recombinase
MKVPEIAAKFGVSASTIWKDLTPGNSRRDLGRDVQVRRFATRGIGKLKIAKRLGVTLGVVYGVPGAPHVSLTEKFGPQVKALRADGLSISAIAHHLKISLTTVKRALAAKATGIHRRRRGRLPPERQRALKALKLLKEGIPKAEVARRMRMGINTVYRIIRLDAAGQPVAIRLKRKPDPKRIRKLFKEGLSKSAIARRLQTTLPTVRLALGEEPPPMAPDRAERIRELFASGLKKSAIAKEMSISLADVYRVLPARKPPTENVAGRRTPPRRRPRAMTIARFAKEQGVPASEVRKAIAAGIVRSITIGKTVLIPHDEPARLLGEAYRARSVQP